MQVAEYPRRGAGPKFLVWLAVAGLAGVLAACSSTGSTSSSSSSSSGGLSGFFSSDDDQEIDPNYFLARQPCPPVIVRNGTESVRLYERNHDGEADHLQFQGALDTTARECNTTETSMTIKLGVRGRAVAGPKGTAGTVNLPLRVAVIKQSTNAVFFSELYSIPVPISQPTMRADFQQVLTPFTFPITAEDGDLIIYTGFDDGS